MGKLSSILLKKIGKEAKKKQERKPLNLKMVLRPIFFKFDTLDCGKVDKRKTNKYRTTSF